MKNTGGYNKVDHTPVMLSEVISALNINPGGIYILMARWVREVILN